MTENKVNTTEDTAIREIVTSRLFDAPRELVWKVWTEPEHVAVWWGPDRFRNTIHVMDVKPGGVWNFIMHGPDGTDYNNKIVFSEILKPEKLVYTHVSGPIFESTVTFEEIDGKTKVTMRAVFESVDVLEYAIKQFSAVEGAKQTFGRLADYLEKVK